VLVVITLGAGARFVEAHVPQWSAGTPFAKALLLISIVFGFIAASIIGTLYVQWAAGAKDAAATIATVDDLRTWFLIFAFVSIGLEFSLKGLREAGWRPIAVFASATVANIVGALGLATVLFGNFQIG
jgi:uncharacterized membrane protein YadS